MEGGKLDAYARPPESLRVLFKKWQKAAPNESLWEPAFSECDERVNLHIPSSQQIEKLHTAFQQFTNEQKIPVPLLQAYEVQALPGLIVFPNLLPHNVQLALLDKLMHRDLCDSRHNTNLHLHYHMPTSSTSLFDLDPDLRLQPRDLGVHKPITVKQVIEKKLRWVTLGGQYDWTKKVYPDERPPPFPSDIADLIHSAFPNTKPEAAILNFYSPGDTLSLHRDVSEECDRDLVSLSIGCDALFLVGNNDGSQTAVIRLRSGDAVIMSGQSRFVWHAVPKVIANTCPSEIREWPGGDWSTWLSNKRINLNVRQMRETQSP